MIKLSQKSIKKIAKIITGDTHISPYKSGPVLVDLFKEVGLDEEYGAGFPSRWKFTEDKLKEINGTDKLANLFEIYLDPRDFIDTEFNISDVVNSLNEILKYDDLRIIEYKKRYKIIVDSDQIVESKSLKKLSSEFVIEQLEKCENKISIGDYDGAITSARTLVETVIIEILIWIDGKKVEYDGNLIKLYKKIQKKLELEPQRKDISESLKQILSGLLSIVNGLASIRNKMGDAHAKNYRPSKHHAIFAVNSALTLSVFLIDSFYYNKKVNQRIINFERAKEEANRLMKSLM